MPTPINITAMIPDHPTPLIVIAAPNGARLGKRQHAAVPLTPTELADEATSLVESGVSILHLHVRDKNGDHTLNAAIYREALAAIRKKVGDRLVAQVTTEALGRYDRHQQMTLVRKLQPEAVSLALRELCPHASTEEGDLLTGTEFCNEFDWLEGSQRAMSGEGSVTANPGGTFFYALWNQEDLDKKGNVIGSDAWFRRVAFIDDYIPGDTSTEEPPEDDPPGNSGGNRKNP